MKSENLWCLAQGMFAASSVLGRVLTLFCSSQKLLSTRKSEALEPLLSHLVEWPPFPRSWFPKVRGMVQWGWQAHLRLLASSATSRER